MTTNVAHILGSQIPASALRPDAREELAQWGGPALVKGKRVLDLGCGDGRFALGIADLTRSVDGVDPDGEMIATANGRAQQRGLRNARFKVGAAQSLPYDDGTFDVVISSWTL